MHSFGSRSSQRTKPPNTFLYTSTILIQLLIQTAECGQQGECRGIDNPNPKHLENTKTKPMRLRTNAKKEQRLSIQLRVFSNDQPLELRVIISQLSCPSSPSRSPCIVTLIFGGGSHKTSVSFVSGKKSAVIVHKSTPPPARYNTPVESPRCAAARGAMMDDRRPQNEASPQAEPRTAAGNASGVQP